MCVNVYVKISRFLFEVIIPFSFSVTAKTGFVSVQGCTRASCASLQLVIPTRVETVPPVFLNLGQILSASVPMGGLDISALMVRGFDY